MKKIAASFIFILALAILASTVWAKRPDSFFSSTIYTVAGIMFSIGLGLIVTFNPSGVKNRAFLLEIRRNIGNVRNSFLIHFGLTTFYYILNQYLDKKEYKFQPVEGLELTFSIPLFLCLLMIYSLIFFIVNFIHIQRLNNDIVDRVNKEQE